MTLKNYYLQLEKNVRPTRPILDHEKKYEDKMYERDIFLEVLPMTGSSASALAVIDIVKNAILGRCGETRNEMEFEVGHKFLFYIE